MATHRGSRAVLVNVNGTKSEGVKLGGVKSIVDLAKLMSVYDVLSMRLPQLNLLNLITVSL